MSRPFQAAILGMASSDVGCRGCICLWPWVLAALSEAFASTIPSPFFRRRITSTCIRVSIISCRTRLRRRRCDDAWLVEIDLDRNQTLCARADCIVLHAGLCHVAAARVWEYVWKYA